MIQHSAIVVENRCGSSWGYSRWRSIVVADPDDLFWSTKFKNYHHCRSKVACLFFIWICVYSREQRKDKVRSWCLDLSLPTEVELCTLPTNTRRSLSIHTTRGKKNDRWKLLYGALAIFFSLLLPLFLFFFTIFFHHNIFIRNPHVVKTTTTTARKRALSCSERDGWLYHPKKNPLSWREGDGCGERSGMGQEDQQLPQNHQLENTATNLSGFH